MPIIQRKSPNQSGKLTPRYLMLHHTASTNFAATVNYLCRRTAMASAHFVVGKDGEVAQLVPLTKQAWHAGRGGPLMRIPKNQGNTYCVGIEIVNKGDGKDPFPEAQLDALDWLIAHIDREIGAYPIIDHKAYTARKVDMARNFPLDTYAQHRAHRSPEPANAATVGPSGATMRLTRSAKGTVVRDIAAGKRVIVHSKTARWCYVEYGGKRGYVLTSQLVF